MRSTTTTTKSPRKKKDSWLEIESNYAFKKNGTCRTKEAQQKKCKKRS